MSAKVSIVTGAAKGIGLGIARVLARRGDLVIGWDVDDDALAKASADISASGGHFESVVVDVTDLGHIDAGIAAAIADHGRLDVMVNNAGVTRRADLMDLTEADWDRIMDVNAKGVFFCQQAAARAMLETGGAIVNNASVAARGYHNASNAIYAASKGAVVTMTKMAAHRLGPHGITVNAICPGITETEIYRNLVERDAEAQGVPVAEIRERTLQTVPTRRSNTIEEVGEMVAYLTSDAARNVTGQAIHIDGGLMPN
ncbi:MAG: SDR family NAD(P)-dependent oxidoreductase [Pseudomonadota bacterium]